MLFPATVWSVSSFNLYTIHIQDPRFDPFKFKILFPFLNLATPTPIPPPKTYSSNCNVCDGITYSTFDISCLCEEDKWWDGEHCVPRAFCPCIVNHDT